MKRITLSKGKYALIDDSDFELISQHKWYAVETFKWYALAFQNKKSISMHRFIMGAKEGQQVDHINGNSLDNRRSNLRFCNNAQNQYNRLPDHVSISKYKGVRWHKRDKLWYAAIKINGKQKWLGYHRDEISAAKTYDAAAKELFGEFAKLNFN